MLAAEQGVFGRNVLIVLVVVAISVVEISAVLFEAVLLGHAFALLVRLDGSSAGAEIFELSAEELVLAKFAVQGAVEKWHLEAWP